MRARLPIRWRLTVWYGALLIASFLLIGTGLFLGLRFTLYDSFREQLANQAALAMSGVQMNGGAFSLDDATRAAMADDEHFIQLYDQQGVLVLDTGGANGRPAPPTAQIAAALAGTSSSLTRKVNGTSYGLAVRPLSERTTIAGTAVVGASRGDQDEMLRLVLLVIGLAAPLVGVAAALGGYWVAGKALAPVAAITNLAGTINARDLGARLALDLPDDELGRLARTFDAMLARIEGAFERQRRFTGDAAHELRTPAGFMRTELDLALAAPRSGEEYRATLERLDGDLRRMTDLLASLLVLARADADRLPLARESFDLADTVAALAEQYESRAAEAGVALAIETQPTRIAADEDLIIQVLINLLENALRHTGRGGRIALGCAPDGERVRAWVEDTGAGIAAEHQQRVFDRFYRVDSGRTRAQGGSGLGLSISREIVRAHGGEIALTSEPGRGTRVEFALPAV